MQPIFATEDRGQRNWRNGTAGNRDQKFGKPPYLQNHRHRFCGSRGKLPQMIDLNGRAGEIRTRDLLHPKQEISTTCRPSSLKTKDLYRGDLDAKWTPKRRTGPFGLQPDSTDLRALSREFLPRLPKPSAETKDFHMGCLAAACADCITAWTRSGSSPSHFGLAAVPS